MLIKILKLYLLYLSFFSFHSWSNNFNDICHVYAKEIRATYSYKGKTISKIVVLGSENCLGACGRKCLKRSVGIRTAYTQECLNHDLCFKRLEV